MSGPLPDLPEERLPGAGPTPPPAGVPAPAARRGALDANDGAWHRMHPLTPLLQGGLVLLGVLAYLVTNLRDRLVGMFVPSEYVDMNEGDPLEWVMANNLIIIAVVVVIAVIALLVGAFWLSWRFHMFRITDTAVEVKQGIISRKQRRAPLDRVQGVNLTRPFLARLIGLAKLEVVGAGADANVKLEYLSTANAERVRADILRLASGLRAQRAEAVAAVHGAPADGIGLARVAHTVGEGLTGLVVGAEEPAGEPESVVHIPVARLLLSYLASPVTLIVLIYAVMVAIASIFGHWSLLLGLIPAVFAVGAYWVGSLLKVLRYSISPTPDGVRVVFGLTTTITETIPPGRIHAVEISQSLLWRPMGWWRIRINRMSGRSQSEQGATDPFTTLLPVGTQDDVARVLGLIFPDLTPEQGVFMFQHGMLGPQADDPFTNTPKRRWFVRPFSWRRNGFLLTPQHLLLRRGVLWRQLAMFPLARTQGITVRQGPLYRALNLGSLQVNSVPGQVSTHLYAVDRPALMALFDDAAAAAVAAGQRDRTHRWADGSAGAGIDVGQSPAAAFPLDGALGQPPGVAPAGWSVAAPVPPLPFEQGSSAGYAPASPVPPVPSAGSGSAVGQAPVAAVPLAPPPAGPVAPAAQTPVVQRPDTAVPSAPLRSDAVSAARAAHPPLAQPSPVDEETAQVPAERHTAAAADPDARPGQLA